MANAYVMRTNMSVAIVAMVNHTFVEAGHKEVFDDECPNYINTTSSVSGYFLFFFEKKKTTTKRKGHFFDIQHTTRDKFKNQFLKPFEPIDFKSDSRAGVSYIKNRI